MSISSVAPLRDLAPGSVAHMARELSSWSKRCEDVLVQLEAEVAAVKASAVQKRAWRRVGEEQVERADRIAGGGGGGGGGNNKGGAAGTSFGSRGAERDDGVGDLADFMDVDDGVGRGGRRLGLRKK